MGPGSPPFQKRGASMARPVVAVMGLGNGQRLDEVFVGVDRPVTNVALSAKLPLCGPDCGELILGKGVENALAGVNIMPRIVADFLQKGDTISPHSDLLPFDAQ
jgi:hypothetical protein